jgi:hypothetical protein
MTLAVAFGSIRYARLRVHCPFGVVTALMQDSNQTMKKSQLLTVSLLASSSLILAVFGYVARTPYAIAITDTGIYPFEKSEAGSYLPIVSVTEGQLIPMRFPDMGACNPARRVLAERDAGTRKFRYTNSAVGSVAPFLSSRSSFVLIEDIVPFTTVESYGVTKWLGLIFYVMSGWLLIRGIISIRRRNSECSPEMKPDDEVQAASPPTSVNNPSMVSWKFKTIACLALLCVATVYLITTGAGSYLVRLWQIHIW